MFDLEDAIDDGVSIDELYHAVDSARMSLKGNDSGGAKYLYRMLESITDDIEMRGAMGEFDHG